MAKFLFCSFLLCSPQNDFSDEIIRTISVEFERMFSQTDKEEVISGHLYHISAVHTLVRIERPVRQWVIYRKNEMLIYYPEDKKAFRIIFEYPVSLPFFQAFLGVLKEDFGLSEMGYSLSQYEKKGSTLISRWAPPTRAAAFLGDVTVEYRDNKLVLVEFKDPKGIPISRSSYSHHLAYNSTFFPMEITTLFDSHSIKGSEYIQLRNATFNSPLPSEVEDFQIPPNVPVKEIRW